MTLGPSLRLAFRTLAAQARAQAAGRGSTAGSPPSPPPPPPPPPPPAATAFQLSGPSSGVTGVASSFSVTPNGPLSGAATVNLSAPSATLSVPSLSFLSGAAAGQSFTVTRATDGTTSVSMTNTLGLTNSGSPIGFTTTAASAFASNSLLSGSTQAAAPFVFGQAIAEGDVPSGLGIAVSGANAQATIKSTWPDGSAKVAIIAGTASLTAATPLTITLAAGTASSGAALTTADLIATGITAQVDAGAFGSAAFGSTEWAAPFETWISGHRMSSWIYRKQVGSDLHLVAWLEVRLFAGGAVEVLPWVENGFIDSSSLANKSATYQFTLGGSARLGAGLAIDVKHRTRPLLVSGSALSHWLGTDPGVTPQHDTAYLQRTGLVPSYMWDSPSAGTLNGLQQTFTPNTLAGISSSMGVAGSSAALIPRAGALYVTSGGDSRAWAAMQVFGYSGGSWSIHYRDAATNYPFRFTDWATASYEGQPVPTGATGGENGSAVTTHQPSYGYLPALLTGRWWFLEESQFWCGYNYLRARVNSRRGETAYESAPFVFGAGSAGVIDARTGAYANRGAHWSIRTLAQTVAITPSTHPNHASYLAAWENNTDFYERAYVLGTHASGAWVSPQGFLGDYSADGNTAYGIDSTSWWGAAWMSTFGVQAWGFASDLGLPQSSASLARHIAVRDTAYKQVTQRAADGVGGAYNWRRFAVFSYPIGSDSTGLPPDAWYTAAQSYSAMLSGFALSSISASVGSTLKTHSADTDVAAGSSTASDYLPMGLSGLAYAFKHNAPGAMDGWFRVTGAQNFAEIAGLHQNPEHGIGPQLPDWVPSPGQFANIGTSTLQSVRPSGWPTSGDVAGPFSNWSSGVYARNLGNKGSYVVHGSGHLSAGTPLWAGIWAFDLETAVWVGYNVPPVPLLENVSDYNSFGESTVSATLGHAYPQHSYDGLVYQPVSQGGGTQGYLWRVGAAGQNYTHRFDLSASNPPTRMFDSQPGSTGYMMTALDEGRNCFYTLATNGNNGLHRINFATPTTATLIAGGYNNYGDNSLIYLPPPYDCLVGMGRANMANTAWKYYVYPLSTMPASFTEITVNVAGAPPADGRSGGCWSTLLQCIVSYNGAGSYTVHKLTPPAPANILTGTWTWTTETLAGANGATPAQCVGSANGAWGRFIEVSWARCFIWADSVNQPTQAWRLTGM